MYPGFSQVTDVLGAIHGRPKAPFEYTNTWGNCLTILLPWLLVAWWSYGSKRQRKWAMVIVAAALIPLVWSLNRTVWVGVALTAVYLAVRFAARGRLAMLGLVCAGLALVGVAVVATPLQGLITSRLQHQQSNSIRGSLSLAAIEDANAAPIIGYGDTRHQQGSASSIAVGPSADCPACGQFPVGSNGQLYLLLVCNGWVGTGLFLSFFAYLAWRYRRDRTPYGMAGVLVILLSFLYMFAYVSVTAALEFTMFSVALLWRNDQYLRQARGNELPASGPGTRAGTGPPTGRGGPGRGAEPGRGSGGRAGDGSADRDRDPELQPGRSRGVLHRDVAVPDRRGDCQPGRGHRHHLLHRPPARPGPAAPHPRGAARRGPPRGGRLRRRWSGAGPAGRPGGQAPGGQPGSGRRTARRGSRRVACPGRGAAVRRSARHPARRHPRLPGHGPDQRGGPDRPSAIPVGRRGRGRGGRERGHARAAVGAALPARCRRRLALAPPYPAPPGAGLSPPRPGSPWGSGGSPAPGAWPRWPRSPSSASTSSWSR